MWMEILNEPRVTSLETRTISFNEMEDLRTSRAGPGKNTGYREIQNRIPIHRGKDDLPFQETCVSCLEQGGTIDFVTECVIPTSPL